VRLRFPKSRMGRFTILLLALWILRALLLPASAVQSLPGSIQLGLSMLTFLLAIPAVYYTWKLFGLIRGKLFWKIRRRLIVAHLLIAAIPVVLVMVIFYISGLLFYYQLSYYLVRNQIGVHSAQILAYNLSLSTNLRAALSEAPENPGVLKTALDRDAKYLLGTYRTASVILRAKDPATGKPKVYSVGSATLDAMDSQAPRWVGDQFSGLVCEDALPAKAEPPDKKGPRTGQLYLRSLVIGEFAPQVPYSLEVSVPFDGDMLMRLKNALGQDLLLADHVQNTSLNVMLQDTEILGQNIRSATFDLDAAQQGVGRSVWSIPLYPVSWSTGTEKDPGDTDVLFVELSAPKLIQNVFGSGTSESSVSRTILGALEFVVGFFLAVVLLSLIGGILLTNSITNAVHNLDRGTEFIRRGDFSQRIVVKSNDQLGALAKSFNQMTEYVQTLVKERVQKERLERELEIAKEVQEQLFPKQAPQMDKMELTGLCLPARVVSGDYYDFLQFDRQVMGMALGDICGKGISAALLMANLQATLRSNVLARGAYKFSEKHGEDGNVAAVVKVLNQQIYNFTSANKFASFFYAVYDDSKSSLTYCNAGHNPPLYFSGDGFRRLSSGGTVVGIFPDAEFDQETIQLHSGDILLAYTDGIVESVNEYGEEFGEQRLINLVGANRDRSAEQLQKAIVDEVLGWAFEEERDDDMTLIVARFH
jgi:sigma-B regulation protein RsbU (phosphoserine phosphatase)